MLKDSIDNGPYQLKPKITVKDTDGVIDICCHQRVEDLVGQDKLCYDSDIKVVNILLLVDSLKVMRAMLERIKLQEQGLSIQLEMQRKRAKDYERFKDKMLLAQAQEAGVVLNDEQQDFLADNFEKTDSTANAIFMVNLSPVGSINADMVEPRYDYDILSEVPHYDTYHDSDMLNSNIQELGYIENIVSNNKSYDELTSNCNVISYTDYMLTIGNDDDNYVPPPV
ncbi:hypothetical protein Tco_0539420 [Tanacetum coccineum]